MYSCTVSARYCRLAFRGKQPKKCIHNNRVESNPLQSSQTYKDAAVTLLLAMAVATVRTHQQRRVPRVLPSQVLKPHSSFSPVRLQWSSVKEEMDSNSYGRINNVNHDLRATKHDLVKKIGKLHYSVIVFLLRYWFGNKSTILIILYKFLIVNVRRGPWVRISVTKPIEQKRHRLHYK